MGANWYEKHVQMLQLFYHHDEKKCGLLRLCQNLSKFMIHKLRQTNYKNDMNWVRMKVQNMNHSNAIKIVTTFGKINIAKLQILMRFM